MSLDQESLDSISKLTSQTNSDPYFQNFIQFKYTLNLLCKNNLSLIPNSALDFYLTKGMYRVSHIAACFDDKSSLKKWTQIEVGLVIIADAYG